jgi:hypothetical protein
MKDYNFLLTTVLCNSFNTETMTAYQHLNNLDFARDASRGHTNFGRIPQADTHYPHLQRFYIQRQPFQYISTTKPLCVSSGPQEDD